MGDPGTDNNIVTEQGIRESITNQTGVESIQFDTTYVPDEHPIGLLHWNSDDGTLEVGQIGGNVVLQIGQENLLYVRNDSGSDITNGKYNLLKWDKQERKYYSIEID